MKMTIHPAIIQRIFYDAAEEWKKAGEYINADKCAEIAKLLAV